MPEFDAIAQRELDRRRATVASQPLATRSMTWPIATGASAEPAAAKELVKPTPRATPRFPKKDWLSDVLRW